MEEGSGKAVEAIKLFLDGEIDAAMNEYNRKAKK